MKLLIQSLFVIILFASSCKQYVYVYEVKADQLTLDREIFVYSNDTIQIVYSFWKNFGEMTFVITNKSDKPLYIDWKKSTFIKNSTKFEYWEDIEIRKKKGTSTGSTFNSTYLNNLLTPFNSISYGVYSINSTEYITRQERITFLPPETNIIRNDYSILEQNIELNQERIKVIQKNDTYYKKGNVLFEDFSMNNSPLIFRNFLTLAFDEDFDEEFHIDNKFYISRVNKMKTNQFKSKPKIDKQKKLYISDYPYKKYKDFYIE